MLFNLLLSRIIRLPLNRVSSINKITKAIPHLEQQFEREPTEIEIVGYLKLPNDNVTVANHIKKNHISFDKPVSLDCEDEASLYDFIQADDIPSPDDNLIQESVAININRVLKKLTTREADILTHSFGLGDKPD